MSVPSLDDAKEARENARDDRLRDNEAGITEEYQIDYSEHSPKDVKGHAEAMILFDHIARINIQTYGSDESLTDLEQNLEGAGMYGFDLELTLANPTIADGVVWVDDPASEYPNYKVLSDPADDSNSYGKDETIHWEDQSEGTVDWVEINGINGLGTEMWEGEPVTGDFDPDYIEVSIPSRKASRILGALDTAGMWFHSQEGEVQEGLFETPPNFGTDEYTPDEDGYPRLVGYPELRADMVGQAGAITWLRGDENDQGNAPTEIDIYKMDGESLQALTPLTPESDAYALPTYPRVNGLYWDHHDSPDSNVDVGADAEPSNPEGVAEAQAMMESEDDAETTYDDLTEDEQSLVDGAIQFMDARGVESIWELDTPNNETDYDSFDERVASVRGDENISVSTDTLADIIDQQ